MARRDETQTEPPSLPGRDRAASPAPYVGQVERARKGDLDAFSALVIAFQDMVVGTAFGWLRDLELARDVAQEAFANAHAALPQLDDPAAFPGWLRRIVWKHCDRATRRGRLEIVPRHEHEWAAGEPGPDQALDDRRASEELRRAVDALPERERLPLVLHYFAGQPQPDVAAFLELPLSTVKKRLRDARARLRDRTLDPERRSPMIEPGPLRPSRDAGFSSTVDLYLALRAGDHARVARMLDASPDLVEAEQSWDPALANDGVLPFASRATPLITAVERGDRAMAALLLERGAEPDGACGCPTGESALWAAVLLGRADLVAMLLEAGADPNRPASTGNAALHVAAMRGHAGIASLLLEHGADVGVRDRGGRTPEDWARAKGFEALADRVASGRSVRTPEPVAQDPGPAGDGRLLLTGVKALDLFAPLAPGSLVRVPFAAGVGMVVLLGELSQRFASQPDRAVVWTGFAQGPFDPQDLQTELRESGIADAVETSIARADEPPETRRRAFADGLARAEALRDRGRQVLVVLLVDAGTEADVESCLARLRPARPDDGAGLTTLVVTPFPETGREVWNELRPPFDGQIAFDRRRARRLLYPAIDPRTTLSRALSRERAGERHVALARAAREAVAAYEALDPGLELPGPGSFTSTADAESARRAQRLLRFLTQPFHTTEPFHGRLARSPVRDELLDSVESILAGRDVSPGEDELVAARPGPR